MFKVGSFDHARGPIPDSRELEYVSALLQTQEGSLRDDATVSAKDFQSYLKSRYGIFVPWQTCREIVQGLGGTCSGDSHEKPTGGNHPLNTSRHDALRYSQKEETDEEVYLDLVQITSILLLSTLVRAKKEVDVVYKTGQVHALLDEASDDIYRQQPPPRSFKMAVTNPILYWRHYRQAVKLKKDKKYKRYVDKLRPNPRRILRDVVEIVQETLWHEKLKSTNKHKHNTHNSPKSNKSGKSSVASDAIIVMDIKWIQNLLQVFGFADKSQDLQLIDEMLELAGGPGTHFNEESLARVLTADIIGNGVDDPFFYEYLDMQDDKHSETFQDVFGFDPVDWNENMHQLKDPSSHHNGSEEDEDGFGIEVQLPATDSMAVWASRADNSQTPATATMDIEEWVSFDEEDDNNNDIGSRRRQVDWSVSQKHIYPEKLTREGSAESNDIFPVQDDQIEVSLEQVNTYKKGGNSNKHVVDASITTTSTSAQATPEHMPTAPYVDYVVDEYRSIIYTVLLWAFYVFASATFLRALNITDFVQVGCESSFGCELVSQIWNWFVFGAILALTSMLIVVPMSLGNHLYRKDAWGSAISLLWTAAFAILPFQLVFGYLDTTTESTPEDELTESQQLLLESDFQLQVLLYMFFGATLAVEIVRTMPGLYNPKKALASSTRTSALMKQAATRKLNSLIRNAHDMHYAPECTGRSPIENFIMFGSTSQQNGGFFWSWKRWLCMDLVKHDGIWLPINMHVGQMCQIVTLLFVAALTTYQTLLYIDSTKERRAEIEKEPPSQLKDWALRTTPEPWMIVYSFFPGILASFVVGVCIICLYLPSTIGTILKLRSGKIETLRNPKFSSLYRVAADSICYNVGYMIFTMIGSMILYWLIVAGFLFLAVWPPTRDFMIVLIGWGLGIGITVGIKMLLTMRLRSTFQEAFYRKLPRKANFVMLALQCWNIGLAAGTISGRLIQFLFAAAFWIGRIDAKFLDDDVKLFGYSFDYTPFNYTKDILVHEAHRHPWIDRLGGMCLLRLKHDNKFGNNAGACWRQVFVVALMPWMLKHRKHATEKEKDEEVLTMITTALTPDAIKNVKKKLTLLLMLQPMTGDPNHAEF